MLPFIVPWLLAVVFAGLFCREMIRRQHIVADATQSHRLALAFLAERQPVQAEKFIIMVLTGNDQALARHFPKYREWCEARIREEQEADCAGA